jgi:hypothetical protein
MQRIEEAGAGGFKHSDQFFFALVSGSTSGRCCASSGSLSAKKQRDAPIALADRLDAGPGHFARGNQRIEAGRRILRNARRQDRALDQRRRQRRALQTFDRIEQRVEISMAAAPRRSSPCQCVRKRASVCCSTGSTSRRSLASDLRRIRRSISASHHSR